MRQIVALRERIFASVGANVACSSVIILLLVAGNPTLQACDGGTVVPDPGNNPGLIKDCRVLLGLRDELGGAESLNWNTGLSIFEWNGVRVSGSPSRVTVLDLGDIAGEIPAKLAQLTQLQGLYLRHAGLTGEIPAELGQLARLEYLDLSINELTGEIPVEVGQLSQLKHLRLNNNELTGEIPVALSRLSNLDGLYLDVNQLSGEIPVALSRLSTLDRLYLSGNQLSGEIPVELGRLSNLDRLYLDHNELTARSHRHWDACL